MHVYIFFAPITYMQTGDAKGEANYAVIKIILISLGIAAFLSVVSSTYSIFQSASPEVLNNCITKPVVFSTTDIHISSQDDALEFLKGRMEGGEYTFIQNTLEVCNPPNTGYVYNSINGSIKANNSADSIANTSAINSANNASYVVCEDGVIYRYETTCVRGENTKSLVSMFSSNKSAK